MKKVLLVLFFAVAAVTVTYAQKDTTTHAKKTLKAAKTHTAADTTHKKVSAMKQIGLTADQQAKIKANNKVYNDKAKQVKADASLTEAEKKAKIKEFNKEKKKGTDTLLTAEQKTKLKEIKKQQKADKPKKAKAAKK